ncbi:MAG: hypothetical protein AB7J35_21135 [Dehalococcoidia bacterium]
MSVRFGRAKAFALLSSAIFVVAAIVVLLGCSPADAARQTSGGVGQIDINFAAVKAWRGAVPSCMTRYEVEYSLPTQIEAPGTFDLKFHWRESGCPTTSSTDHTGPINLTFWPVDLGPADKCDASWHSPNVVGKVASTGARAFAIQPKGDRGGNTSASTAGERQVDGFAQFRLSDFSFPGPGLHEYFVYFQFGTTTLHGGAVDPCQAVVTAEFPTVAVVVFDEEQPTATATATEFATPTPKANCTPEPVSYQQFGNGAAKLAWPLVPSLLGLAIVCVPAVSGTCERRRLVLAGIVIFGLAAFVGVGCGGGGDQITTDDCVTPTASAIPSPMETPTSSATAEATVPGTPQVGAPPTSTPPGAAASLDVCTLFTQEDAERALGGSAKPSEGIAANACGFDRIDIPLRLLVLELSPGDPRSVAELAQFWTPKSFSSEVEALTGVGDEAAITAGALVFKRNGHTFAIVGGKVTSGSSEVTIERGLMIEFAKILARNVR